MGRNMIARFLLTLGTIFVSASFLLLVGLLGSDFLQASEWAPISRLDRTYKLKQKDPAQTCEARYIADIKDSDNILESDCNSYNNNLGKTCIRCNGKYTMVKEDNPTPEGPGVGSSFIASCGYLMEATCTFDPSGQYLTCGKFFLSEVRCGDVTEFTQQSLVDP